MRNSFHFDMSTAAAVLILTLLPPPSSVLVTSFCLPPRTSSIMSRPSSAISSPLYHSSRSSEAYNKNDLLLKEIRGMEMEDIKSELDSRSISSDSASKEVLAQRLFKARFLEGATRSNGYAPKSRQPQAPSAKKETPERPNIIETPTSSSQSSSTTRIVPLDPPSSSPPPSSRSTTTTTSLQADVSRNAADSRFTNINPKPSGSPPPSPKKGVTIGGSMGAAAGPNASPEERARIQQEEDDLKRKLFEQHKLSQQQLNPLSGNNVNPQERAKQEAEDAAERARIFGQQQGSAAAGRKSTSSSASFRSSSFSSDDAAERRRVYNEISSGSSQNFSVGGDKNTVGPSFKSPFNNGNGTGNSGGGSTESEDAKERARIFEELSNQKKSEGREPSFKSPFNNGNGTGNSGGGSGSFGSSSQQDEDAKERARIFEELTNQKKSEGREPSFKSPFNNGNGTGNSGGGSTTVMGGGSSSFADEDAKERARIFDELSNQKKAEGREPNFKSPFQDGPSTQVNGSSSSSSKSTFDDEDARERARIFEEISNGKTSPSSSSSGKSSPFISGPGTPTTSSSSSPSAQSAPSSTNNKANSNDRDADERARLFDQLSSSPKSKQAVASPDPDRTSTGDAESKHEDKKHDEEAKAASATQTKPKTIVPPPPPPADEDPDKVIRGPLYLTSMDASQRIAAVNGGGLTVNMDQPYATIQVDIPIPGRQAFQTLSLLLDTACSGLVLRPSVVEKHKLPLMDTPVTMTGAGGQAGQTKLTQLDKFYYATHEFGPLPAAVQNIGALPSSLDGIIGLSFLSQFPSVELDFERGELVLYRKDAPPMNNDPRLQIVAKGEMKYLPWGICSVDTWLGSRGPVTLLVDSGASSTFLNWVGVQELGLDRNNKSHLMPIPNMGAMGSDNIAMQLTHRLHVSSTMKFEGQSLYSGLSLAKERRLPIDIGDIGILDQMRSHKVGGILGIDALMRCASVRMSFGGPKREIIMFDRKKAEVEEL